ncbi:arginine--tRNA ligase [Chitinispirillales bacterium ANBcel5]|uniref:arginine--tRNA ligase n=1 Tax=Cellulosispirillum alkaliphilum TaxID=3039283 RepID=UPI002A584EC0|nr:arginine--tRNA ligase [Chitinispirillales bacterium ANBcel5]
MKEHIVDILSKNLEQSLEKDTIERLIEIPPNDEFGDYAFPCFSLSKVLKKNPAIIAADLSEKINESADGIEAKNVSGYINFFIDKKMLAQTILASAKSEDYGALKEGQKVVVEFASPNTNKPLHLGHLRNMSIGDSVSRILEYAGNEVVRTSINNDRGVHICKSMLSYSRRAKGETPQSARKKSDHFVGDYYVLFNNESSKDSSWNDDAQEMLRKWEAGDEEVVSLWKQMNKWALDGFRETYRRFGIRFDKEYYESNIYKSGKEIVHEGLDRGVFKKRDDNAVYIDLEEEKLGEKVVLRPDGTSVYIVQDLFLALLKKEEYNYDKSIYVVGNEQDYHFAVLIAIFKRLGYDIADKIKHLSYGMVELPEGKMKSREGTVVDADDLIAQTQELAKDELAARYSLSEEEMELRSHRITLAAIKYQLLKVDITRTMVFDPKKAISFEGDTGPYLLYSYARASSILRKANVTEDYTINDLHNSEIKLFKKIGFFPSIIQTASKRLSPSVIACYSFELSQLFNEFYHNCKVIDSKEEAFRLNLVRLFRKTLSTCLDLLGIEKIEEM